MVAEGLGSFVPSMATDSSITKKSRKPRVGKKITENQKVRRSPRIAERAANGIYRRGLFTSSKKISQPKVPTSARIAESHKNGSYARDLFGGTTTTQRKISKSNREPDRARFQAAGTTSSLNRQAGKSARPIISASATNTTICRPEESGKFDDLTTDVIYVCHPLDAEPSSRRNTDRLTKSKAPISELEQAKVFGHISTVPVGTCLPLRQDFHNNLVHRNPVKGIFGDVNEGAYSIVLSGGYEDNHDQGERFVFTGEGGRKNGITVNGKKANHYTAAQSMPQKMERGNLALKRSCENGRPVRVIRGSKGNSIFAPISGYRYDGVSCPSRTGHICPC